ncbi:spore germination protein [Anaerocolumna sedimenticola]|uniref:Spore germination protein n=1 Tax=Anaerocolumna sedimenticola TaxID=2696063 RepID=A0A6P1TPY7_9FIRM|nr:spore germination protein [Anaerocolumna sedimenticola]QHQ62397.1 spore germination protein [Anaerocolumna sedimenticola]
MSLLHDEQNRITAIMSKNLSENIDTLSALFVDCADVTKRKLTVGDTNKVDIYIIYVDNMINKGLLEEVTVQQLFASMTDMPAEGQFDYIKEKGLRTVDVAEVITMNAIIENVLSGDTVILVDGYDKAIKVSVRGMPNRGVPTSENEVAIRGSKESFSEAFYINRVLLRRRIKDTNLKIKQFKVGVRSHTDVAICYLEDVAKPEIVGDIEKRLKEYVIDGIFDSGMLEQLTERNVYSPFPEFQTTERPDKAASAILEGRVVILVDNSPLALLLPTTLNSFFQASDDSYSRWEVATFTRILRYFGAFLSIALPGLYIAVINYNAEVLTSAMALSFAAARDGVPFSVLFEVVMMEVAFQMLLEAGIRLPGPMGSTLGIVGGLIIGDAAVNANLVSPIVVIVIALTAISAFTVPNEPFASAFRIVRYLIIILSAFLGLYGFILGIMLLLNHLGGLKSFGMPYLVPFAASGINEGTDTKDAIVRLPLRDLKRRPIFSRKDERTRLVKNKDE